MLQFIEDVQGICSKTRTIPTIDRIQATAEQKCPKMQEYNKSAFI
jgi:hypothetical protein